MRITITEPLNMSINLASADRSVSGYYTRDAGDLEEWVRTKIDEAVDNWQSLRLSFDDETDHYTGAAAAARGTRETGSWRRLAASVTTSRSSGLTQESCLR
jgi:hypothetical protein